MKLSFLLWIFVCLNFAYGQVPRTQTAAQNVAKSSVSLPIKRVIIYSNGVAYIERRGLVTGDVKIDLPFKHSQVDDVLKSMLVLDLGNGRINTINYGSSQPASARTAEIPFAIDTNESGGLAEVLKQLQGATIAANSTKGIITGRILTLEKRAFAADKDRPATFSQFLVLASEEGEISEIDLVNVRSIRLLEKGTKQNINEFTEAVATSRQRDSKTISITGKGTGTREMIVSYTIAAPIWKTTYRVVLDQEGNPFFQGWAIVDNVSDEDWSNVQLSMISGSPVSFIQNLQKPLYRYRPIIPIPDDLQLTPQIYDPESGSGYGSGSGSGGGYAYGTGVGDGGPPPPRLSTPTYGDPNSNFIASSGYTGTSVSDLLVNEKSGVITAADGMEIGDLFEYRIEHPVSLARNNSALIPIIQTKMEGERVSIFRAAEQTKAGDDDDDESANVRRANPRAMSGLLLKNTSAMTFEGGPMTIIDKDAYAGEALMERLKPKEQRLISFSLDLGTLIRVNSEQSRIPSKLVKVVDGILQIYYFKQVKKTYRLQNQTDRPRVVYIEHPIDPELKLDPAFAVPDLTTSRFYRFRVELKGFENKEITVGENLPMMDKFTLSSFSPRDLGLVMSGQYIDEATRGRLAKMIELRMRINDINTKLEGLNREVSEISADQMRFRANIESLAKTPDAKQLIARYIAKANEQETRLEVINKERQTLQQEMIQLEREMATEIKNFEVN